MITDSDQNQDCLEVNLPKLVTELRSAAKESYGLLVPEDCDGFIKRCLRQKDYNPGKALQQMKHYHDMVQDVISWNVPLKPSIFNSIYRNCSYSLSKRDSVGRRVIIIKLAAWNPKEFTYEEWVVAMWCLVQYAMYEFIESQLKGIVMVVDCTDFSMQHAWNMKIHRSITSAKWIQNGVSCRLKALHVIHHPKIISAIWSAIKPFLKEKMIQRFHFHDNLKSLHKHIDASILPPWFREGNADNTSFNDEDFYNGLLQQDQLFQGLLRAGFPTK